MEEVGIEKEDTAGGGKKEILFTLLSLSRINTCFPNPGLNLVTLKPFRETLIHSSHTAKTHAVQQHESLSSNSNSPCKSPAINLRITSSGSFCGTGSVLGRSKGGSLSLTTLENCRGSPAEHTVLGSCKTSPLLHCTCHQDREPQHGAQMKSLL